MNNAERTRSELLEALAELGRLWPEWRLGQTHANLATTAGGLDADGVWEIADDEALAAAKSIIEQFSEVAPVATG